jgi:hypothetical protein
MASESGLTRWSRLKHARTKGKEVSGASAPVPGPAVDETAPVAAVESRSTGETPEGEGGRAVEVAPEDLPDPETLDKDSDFTVVLGDGVPEAIKRKALSALWRSDPVLANLDGLNDYDEDFGVVQAVGEAVKTAYRVGQGYLEDADEETVPDGGAATDGDAVADESRNAGEGEPAGEVESALAPDDGDGNAGGGTRHST